MLLPPFSDEGTQAQRGEVTCLSHTAGKGRSRIVCLDLEPTALVRWGRVNLPWPLTRGHCVFSRARICPTSLPDLGTKAQCFPHLPSGGPEGGQRHSKPGQVSWLQSQAQPSLLLIADLTTQTSRPHQEGNRRGGSHATPATAPPVSQLTTPNTPSPVDLQKRK